MRQCVFHYSAVCFHCVCICLVSLSTHLQRSFQLEDANDIEIRQLKEKVASMTAESQTATSKLQQQDEQSEEEHIYVVRYNQGQVYIGQTYCIHICLHTYIRMYVQTVHFCTLHTYKRTYLLEPKGITMVEPQVIIAII